MKTLSKSLIVSTILLLVGCTVSQISVSLAAIADATEAATLAVPILEASGVLPVGIGNIILAYTQAVSTAASQSSAELLTTDTAAVKAEKIAGYFAGVTAPVLGLNTSAEIKAIVQAISSAVNLFLSQFNSPAAKLAIKVGTADKHKLSMGDRHAIGSLQKKFTATAAKCQSLMKK